MYVGNIRIIKGIFERSYSIMNLGNVCQYSTCVVCMFGMYVHNIFIYSIHGSGDPKLIVLAWLKEQRGK